MKNEVSSFDYFTITARPKAKNDIPLSQFKNDRLYVLSISIYILWNNCKTSFCYHLRCSSPLVFGRQKNASHFETCPCPKRLSCVGKHRVTT